MSAAGESNIVRVAEAELAERVASRLREAGASEESLAAATRALMHASRLGIDSHGVRLTEHYCRVLQGGRINRRPQLNVVKSAAASAILDGDDGLGHYAAYRAMELAVGFARTAGIGAVGVRRSSHLGAAGAFALAAAEAGCLSFATTHANSFVALFDGAEAFHGTNPLAFAAPVPGQKPWLFDMATSSIPMNRVALYGALERRLPEGVAANERGDPVTEPDAVRMLLPLGGTEFGYKGAGLAGVATVFSAVLTGATLDHDLLSMFDYRDTSTPRNLGAFVLAIDPEKFVGASAFGEAIMRYLGALRGAPSRSGGGPVMAPGDREWAEAERRAREGIPIDLHTAEYLGFA